MHIKGDNEFIVVKNYLTLEKRSDYFDHKNHLMIMNAIHPLGVHVLILEKIFHCIKTRIIDDLEYFFEIMILFVIKWWLS